MKLPATTLAAIRARCEAATLGDLSYGKHDPKRVGIIGIKWESPGDDWSPSGALRLEWIDAPDGTPMDKASALARRDLIVTAINELPAMLSHAQAVEAEYEGLRRVRDAAALYVDAVDATNEEALELWDKLRDALTAAREESGT